MERLQAIVATRAKNERMNARWNLHYSSLVCRAVLKDLGLQSIV